MTNAVYDKIIADADEAGKAAAAAMNPTPVNWVEREDPLNDKSKVVHAYPTDFDGVCGFAWVNLKPANSHFAKYLKTKGWKKRFEGPGIYLWISQYNQSMQRKEAYAYAFAKVLTANGFNAWAGSRMD